MDTALIVALIGVGGTALAALAGVAGTLISQRMTNSREANRLEKERQLKELEQEHDREEKRREERLRAYRDFYAAIIRDPKNELRAVDPTKQPEAGLQLLNEINRGLSEIYLLASLEVIVAANALYEGVRALSTDRDNREKKETLVKFRGEFMRAVRRDLDVSLQEFGQLGGGSGHSREIGS